MSANDGDCYRYYVSSVLLRGRKAAAGSVSRVSAARIEDAVRVALASHGQAERPEDASLGIEQVQRVTIARDRLSIELSGLRADDSHGNIQIPWSAEPSNSATVIDHENAPNGGRNEGLIQGIVRAHTWIQRLSDGTHGTVEELAKADRIHAKVARQALRLAYLAPEIGSHRRHATLDAHASSDTEAAASTMGKTRLVAGALITQTSD
jgi:site-specific DNA recombinase